MSVANLCSDDRAAPPSRARLPRRINGWTLLLLPCVLFLTAFFLMPLLVMAVRSVTDPGPENYTMAATSELYRRVLRTTFITALIVMVVSFALGYPYAYAMYRARPNVAILLGLLVLLPFWTSFLVRTYAWIVLLQDSGVINQLLVRLGIVESPIRLMRNTFGVAVGLTHVFLPFMVLPVYAAMRRVDRDLVPAAKSLGAPPFKAFWRVFFPLTMPGVYAGCVLVFVPALGFYITPALLGSPRNAMFSELIVLQINELLAFGRGSALGIILLVITVLVLWFSTKLVPLDRVFAPSTE